MSYEQKVAIGSLAVLVLGISIIVALNSKASPQGGTAGRPEHPVSLIKLDPEQVKDLISKRVSAIALLGEDSEDSDDIVQVVGLFASGKYEAGIPIVEKSPVQGSLPRSPEFGASDFVVKQPIQALSCNKRCESCSSRNCKNVLGDCMNC